MKKITIIVVTILCNAVLSFGQYINPSQPESIYPQNMPFYAYNITHTSNAACGILPTDMLNVYGWSGEGTGSPSGIAWRWTSNDGTMVNGQGALNIDGLMDVEVAVLNGGFFQGQATVIVAYYRPGTTSQGHYYTVFKFTTSGGLVPQFTMQLSSAASYGRISIDAIQLHMFTMVWQDGNDLRMATGGLNGSLVTGPFTIAGASGGKMPDVAGGRGFNSGGGSTLVARIVYLDASGQLVCSHWDINDPSLTFITDDVIAAPIEFTTMAQSSDLSSRLSIDIPDIYDPYQYENWTYTYQSFYDIIARIHVTGSPANSYNLTNGSIFLPNISVMNNWPTLAYDETGHGIYYGWWTKATGRCLAVKIKDDGTPLIPGYMVVSNQQIHQSPMAFCKAFFLISPIQYLYVMYPRNTVYTPISIGTDMIVKQNAWGNTAFRQIPSGVETINAASGKHLTAYPNPFKDAVHLSVDNGNSADEYEVIVTNIQGQLIQSTHGNISVINSALAMQNSKLASGTYILHISGASLNESLKLIKQ